MNLKVLAEENPSQLRDEHNGLFACQLPIGITVF